MIECVHYRCKGQKVKVQFARENH